MHISVIIPFFQEERGLLRRALLSILSASRTCRLTIIVIDDESPVDLNGEVESIDFGAHQDLKFRTLRQKNKGVIGARNAGLDAVDSDCDVIVFLDADDYWKPCRLQKIEAAFAAGADFYFSDFFRQGGEVSRFEWSRFSLENATEFDSVQKLCWVPNSIITMICAGQCPIGTSTVAYRRSNAVQSIRFNSDFKRCGEDHYFYVELLFALGPHGLVCVSREVDTLFGEGVGLETNATWGTVASLQRSIDTCRLHYKIESFLSSDSKDYSNNRIALNKMDVGFFETVVVVGLKNRINPIPYLVQYFSFRPLFQLSFLTAFYNIARRTLRNSRFLS